MIDLKGRKTFVEITDSMSGIYKTEHNPKTFIGPENKFLKYCCGHEMPEDTGTRMKDLLLTNLKHFGIKVNNKYNPLNGIGIHDSKQI